MSGGGGGESGAVLAGVKDGTPAAQGEFKVIPGLSVAVFVCYFVFDWWGVSTAIKIRLYAGLLSLLPLRVWGVIACAQATCNSTCMRWATTGRVVPPSIA